MVTNQQTNNAEQEPDAADQAELPDPASAAPAEGEGAESPEQLVALLEDARAKADENWDQLLRARAEIENSDHAIRPGMLLSLVLRANPQRSLAISEAALVPRGSSQFVVVVGEDGSTRRVEVQTGRRVPGIVELRSGLDADARVVIDGASLIPPGGMVRVLEEQPPPSV